MLMRWLCAAMVLSVTGCLDGTSPFDGYGPPFFDDPPSGPTGWTPPSGPPGPVVTMDGFDDVADVPAAVNGIYHLHVAPTETSLYANSIDPGLTARVLPDAIEVVASRAGRGAIQISNAIGTTTVVVEAAIATRVVVVPPRYQPLADAPVAYLGPEVTGTVRELDAEARPLSDHSIAVTGNGVTGTEGRFTLKAKAGLHALTVTAGGLPSSARLDLETMDTIDDLIVTETPLPDLHRLCGHAIHGDAELFARVTFTGVASLASPFANCVELPPSAVDRTLTVRAGGLTRTHVVHAH